MTKTKKKKDRRAQTDEKVAGETHCARCKGHLRGHGVWCAECGYVHLKCSGLINADEWFEGFVCSKPHRDQSTENGVMEEGDRNDGDAKTPPTPAQASSPHTALPDEDATCGTCNKNISTKDKAVECEVCLIWFHTKCHNVSKALYDVLCDDNNRCHWFCDHCNKGASKLYQSMAALSRQHQTLQTRVNKLADDTESTKTDLAMLKTDTDKAISALTNTTNTKIDNLETNINSAKQDYDSLQQRVKKLEETQQTPTPSNATPAVAPLASNSSCFQTFRENMTEMEMIRARKKNLVIHNLPEGGNEENDLQAASELFKHEFKLSIKINKATRLGKTQDTKARLLRVELEDFSEKKLILSKASELRNSNHDTYKLVYIRPDLTKRQLEESKNLRDELANKRKNQPDQNWVIRRNRVIATTNQDPGQGGGQ